MGDLAITLGEVVEIAASCPNLCGLSVGAGYGTVQYSYTNPFLA